MLHVSAQSVAFILFSLFIIYLIARLATAPVQAMIKLIVNSMAAVVLLCMISIVGDWWGLHLPINPVTVLLIAILGLPGLLLVLFLNFLFL